MRSDKINAIKTTQILYQEEGFLRFWKGSGVAAIGCIPAHAGQFCLYEVLKKFLHFKNDKFSLHSTMFIGAATTVAHDFFQVPADVIKQRM